MEPSTDDIQRLSPDRLMAGFTRSPLALSLVIAVGLHVAVIASTSMRYVRDTWIDPEAAEQRRAEAEKVKLEAARQQREERDARRKAATQRAATQRAPGTTTTTRPAGGDAGVPDRAMNSKTYKATTQTAAPGEIPRRPDDLTVPLE